LNEDGVHELTGVIIEEVRSYYRGRTLSRDNVFEVLNALAASTANILRGTGNDPGARDFFFAALDKNIKGGCNA
jgi:hypothetical protein